MLTVKDYKVWANQDRNSAVAINRTTGELEAATNQIGQIARFFHLGPSRSVRTTVMKDFTRALTSRYGASIAKQAIALAGLSRTSELRASNIEHAISAAKTIRAAMLRPSGVAQNLKLGNTEISQLQVGTFLTDKRNVVTKFLKQRAVAVQLLGEMPLSSPDYEDFHDRADKLVERLNKLKASASDPGSLPESISVEDFTDGVDRLINALKEKDAQASALLAGRPFSQTNIQEYKDIWRSSAINAMIALGSVTVEKNEPAANAIERAMDLLRNDPQVRQQFDRSVELSKDVAKKFIAPFVINLIKGQLEQANIRNFKLNTKDIIRKLDFGYRQTLNERPWDVVNKTISTAVGSRPVKLISTISPAAQLGHTAQLPRGPIAADYPPSVNGYMCHTADTHHAVNLAVSRLSVSEAGAPPTLVFSGVRHGVHCAWEINDDIIRTAANAQRAKEAVIAAFLAKYDGTANPPPLPDAGQDGTITVPLHMSSVSLLTPDTIRHTIKKNSSSDERRMLVEQSAAWDAVARDGVTFQYNGKQIHLKPTILKFNLGVNAGAVKFSKINETLFGGWDLSSQMNSEAFAMLSQEAEAFIQNTHNDMKSRNAARVLLNQCRQVFQAKGERRDSHDAYKLAARIAVLTQLLGNVPCWNCKSGKDRTGEMDVECKFLATLIARGETIPSPGARLTEEQKALFRSIALEGGNFEIQKMNTGVAGFKTGGVSSIPERLGGKNYREFHSGGSQFVNV